MQSEKRREWLLLGSASLVAIALVLLRLDASGVWDPWELDVAEAARLGLEEGFDATKGPPLPPRLLALGFSLFGVHGWAGRLPLALVGLLCLVATYHLVRRYRDERAGALAVLILATTPLMIFGSRSMFGHSPAVLSQLLVALGALGLAFPSKTGRKSAPASALWLLLLLFGAALGVGTAGVLRGVFPPMAAVGVVALLSGKRDPRRHPGALLLGLGSLALVAGLVDAVLLDADAYSHWTGGRATGGDPPTYEAMIEAAFFGLAPFSALAVVALPAMLLPRASASDPPKAAREHAFRLSLVLWAAFGYGAETLFASRYGAGAFVSLAPAAFAVALFLRDLEEERRAEWMAAMVSALFVGLLIRDFAMYPASPIAGMGLDALRIPDAFSARRGWAIVLSIFGAAALFTLGPNPTRRAFAPATPYRWLREMSRADLGSRLWLLVFALLLLAMLIFGVACWAMGDALGIPSQAVRVGKALAVAPLALALLALLLEALLAGAPRLGRHRLAPLLLAGVVVGAYTAHGYQARLSEMLSPRNIYDRYSALRGGEDEPLGEFHAGARAARYYAGGDIESLSSLPDVMSFLEHAERRWLVVPSSEVTQVDLAFRQRAGRHLFLPDAPEGQVTLLANIGVEGLSNANPLEGAILEGAPPVEHAVGAFFEDKVELVGYDLDLPEDGYVGGGQSFVVTWYWRCITDVGRSYKVFLHIDGGGSRIHGDHEPVGGLYLTNRWQAGEVIADRQEIRVPGSQAPGSYQFMVGLYAGQDRLEVVRGPQDGENRVRAGTLRIR